MKAQYSDPAAVFFFLNVYPRLLELLFLAWLALAAAGFKAIVSQFKPLVTRRGAAAALAVLLGAAAAQLVFAPPRHQVYFDEFLHQDIAANVARNGVFGESAAGGSDELRRLQPPHWPGGYHVLLGALFRAAGVSERTAFGFSAALASLSVALMFLLCTLLFADQRAGLIGAALLAALPLHLRFAGAADLTACSEFWVLAALLAFALHRRLKTDAAALLLLASALYAVNVRLENVVLVPLALAAAAAGTRAKAASRARVAGAAAFLVLLAPALVLLLKIYGDALLGVYPNLCAHVPANLRTLGGMPENALILVPAALFVFFRGTREEKGSASLLLALAASYLVVCSAHFKGDYALGSFERLAVPAELCLVAAASCGLNRALASVRAKAAGFAAVLAAAVALSRPSYGKTPLARYEKEYLLIMDSAPLLPADSYVLTYCVPVILVAAGRPAVMAPLADAYGDALLDKLDRGGLRPLVLFKDVWWYKFADSSGPIEARLRARYRFEPIKTAPIDGEEYGFYRLTRLSSAAPPS